MFAHTSAATVAPASTEALPVSVRRNSRSGVSRARSQAVRPENNDPADSAGPDSADTDSAGTGSAAAASLTAASLADHEVQEPYYPERSVVLLTRQSLTGPGRPHPRGWKPLARGRYLSTATENGGAGWP